MSAITDARIGPWVHLVIFRRRYRLRRPVVSDRRLTDLIRQLQSNRRPPRRLRAERVLASAAIISRAPRTKNLRNYSRYM